MGTITFDTISSELLNVTNSKKRFIQIDNFKLSVIGLVRLTSQMNYMVSIELPKGKKRRINFITTLEKLKMEQKILDYVVNCN